MKFSIITVSFNSAKTIERTIKSILGQSNKDYEYIIVDGNSKDETMTIVKHYEPLFEGRVRWVSEPDTGIYNAMNKGIQMAKGDIIGILNSDDWLEPNSLSTIKELIEKKGINGKEKFVITGGMMFHYSNGTKQVISRNIKQFISGAKIYDMYLNHPATWVSSAAYAETGYFDENIKIMADNDLMIRLLKNNVDFYFISNVLTNMSDGGVSNKFSFARLNDRKIIIWKYEKNILKKVLLLIHYFVKECIKWIIPSSLLVSYRKFRGGVKNLEQKINYHLNKYPAIKKVIKRAYQLGMYAVSPKIRSEGNITKVSPDEDGEYFFGYYDKSPWDATGRYMLCMRAKDTWSEPDPLGEAEIFVLDTETGTHRKVATTRTWNVQQGCMAQWLGPEFKSRILYNDLRDGKYCSVILDIETNKERVLPMPVYTVSADGKTALSLDFSRLHSMRLGYGYAELPEKTKGVALPEEIAVWRMYIETGEVVELLKYTDFANFQPREEMKEAGSVHKVNHLMLSPNGKRFMVLYRWFCGQRKYTRLITCNVDGTEMYVLSDDDMVSHCYWKNDEEIIAFERKKETGPGYYLMKDKTPEYKHLWAQLSNDGHPSYCPIDNTLIVTDSYPNRARIADIKLVRDTDPEASCMKVIARVFAPFKYDNDTRCDLHPRWSRDGKKICFDSVFEGHRGLYVVDIENNE